MIGFWDCLKRNRKFNRELRATGCEPRALNFRYPKSQDHTIRLNVFLALAGLGSRRAVEKLILQGKVVVNGAIVRNLATRVDSQQDQVLCEDKPVRPHRFQYVMLNKPRGYTCTRRDPHAKKTIYELLPQTMKRLAYAGRLDMDSEGLVLLSNDGNWLNRLAHPRHAVSKVYEVEVKGFPTQRTLGKMCEGIRSKGEWLKADTVEILEKHTTSTYLRLTLSEGKNREIRRLLGGLHHPVLHLKRIAIGNLTLGSLKIGRWRELLSEEI